MQATEDADNFKTIIEHSAQGIALTEALVPRTAEDRMIGNLVLDAELAKPPVGEIDPHLSANSTLGADCEHVADDQHPDHERRRPQRSATRQRSGLTKRLSSPTERASFRYRKRRWATGEAIVPEAGIRDLPGSEPTP
jgi:hypothetical protein